MFAPNSRRQGGYSLVSLMVGLVISMLVGLTAMGSLQAFTVTQRESAGVGSVLGTGTTSLGVVKYELSQAGRGLYQDGGPLCSSFNLSHDDTVLADGEELRPVDVAWDEKGQLTLDIRYAQALEVASAVPLATAVTKEGVAELSGRLRVAAGQAVMLAPPEGSAGICTVRTVTAITAATTETGMQLTFGATGQHNKAMFTTPAVYPEGSRVYLLGSFEHVQFRQDGEDLRMARPLVGQDIVLATRVRAFNLQMGVINKATGNLQEWVTPHTLEKDVAAWQDLTTARMEELRALRVGFTVQSAQRDKPGADGICSSTPVSDAPTLFGDQLDIEGDETCFKYRVFMGVVPLRNIALAQAQP